MGRIEIKCEICNRVTKSLGIHLKSHKVQMKDYYDKYIRKSSEIVKCNLEECNELVKFKNLHSGYDLYCCRSHQLSGSWRMKNTRDSRVSKLSMAAIGHKLNGTGLNFSESGKVNHAKAMSIKMTRTNIENWKSIKYRNKMKLVSSNTMRIHKSKLDRNAYISKLTASGETEGLLYIAWTSEFIKVGITRVDSEDRFLNNRLRKLPRLLRYEVYMKYLILNY